MFQIIRTEGTPYVLYYLPTIFFGSFFLYNLVLAVVIVSFNKEKKGIDLEVCSIFKSYDSYSFVDYPAALI